MSSLVSISLDAAKRHAFFLPVFLSVSVFLKTRPKA